MARDTGKSSFYIFYFTVSALLVQINSLFCSAYCKPNFCTGIASTQCTACDYPFILQPNNTCTVDPDSPYVMFEEQATIFNLQGTASSTCGPYTFKGAYTFLDVVPLRTNTPITIPHYAVRFISWAILTNGWDLAADSISGTLNTSGMVRSQNVSTYSTAELLCSWSTVNQWYIKLDFEYPHTDTLNRLRVTLSTTDVQQERWGIKDYMILVAKCHVACLKCLDETVLNCSQCATGFKLSGTTCNQSCLYRYGQSNSSFCVACDFYCTACYGSSVNCSACETNGTYQSFLNFTSCVTTCPSTFTKWTLNHTCVSCNSTLCDICPTDTPAVCLKCLTGSYWFDFDCLTTCPPNYYPAGTNCSQCDNSCEICSGVPSPCTVCATNYFLHTTQCLSSCPTGFFGFVPLKQCLDCPTYCVTATVSMVLSPDNRKLISTITFSKPVDFNTFPYSTFYSITTNDSTLNLQYKFTTQYNIIDAFTYSIQLVPKPTINMSSTDFIITINPKTQDFYSTNGYMFNDNIYTLTAHQPWTLIVYPELSGDEAGIVTRFQEFNDGINLQMGGQFVQEFKKSGVFSLLLPGAQLCSTVLLHNSIQAQNFYEGARFWGSFIYFQVPKWQKGPNLKKYLVDRSVASLVHEPTLLGHQHNSRHLQTQTVQNWRFHRTGHTQFFIFDTYLLLGLLVVCWILLLIPKICSHKISANKRSIFYNILHKFHEISLFYITISVILEWITISNKINSPSFNDNKMLVYVSLGLSLAAAVYFLVYEVYIFYRLIPYGHVEAGSSQYAIYVEKYSYYLRDIRFQEYKAEMIWTPRHLLRPYNYQILSCIRLVWLVSALPIFHGYSFAAICCISLIQLLEILRIVLTWPYNSLWRNLIKILLQVLLLGIFVIFLGLYLMIVHIYQNLNTVTNQYISSYYMMGWIGVGFIFGYNILFIIYQIIDVVMGCKYTNQERMDKSRQQYYYEILSQYEQITLNKIQANNKTQQPAPAPARYYVGGKITDAFDDTYGMINTNQKTNRPASKTRRKKDETDSDIKDEKDNNNYIHQMIKKNQEKNTDNVNNVIRHRLKKQLQIDVEAASEDYQKQLEMMQEERIAKKSKFINFVTGLHGGQYAMLEPKISAAKRRKTIQKIIKSGNLINQNYGGLKKEWVKIEQFEIKYTESEQKYEVKVQKVPAVFMRPQISRYSQSNILAPSRDTKFFKLTPTMNRQYFIIIDTLFKGYGSILTQHLIIRTFLTIDQNLYQPSQEIPQIQANLSQWIEIKEFGGSVAREKLQTLLPGFPVPNSFIEKL